MSPFFSSSLISFFALGNASSSSFFSSSVAHGNSIGGSKGGRDAEPTDRRKTDSNLASYTGEKRRGMPSGGREGGRVTGKVAKARSCVGSKSEDGAEAACGAVFELTGRGEAEVDEEEEEKEEAERGRGNTGKVDERKEERDRGISHIEVIKI